VAGVNSQLVEEEIVSFCRLPSVTRRLAKQQKKKTVIARRLEVTVSNGQVRKGSTQGSYLLVTDGFWKTRKRQRMCRLLRSDPPIHLPVVHQLETKEEERHLAGELTEGIRKVDRKCRYKLPLLLLHTLGSIDRK